MTILPPRIPVGKQPTTTGQIESQISEKITAFNLQRTRKRAIGHLRDEVDPEQSNIPLTAYCFMTGFIDAVAFTAVSVWCGFQTGNTIELALALPRLLARSESPGPNFQIIDSQTLTSILSFLFGVYVGRIGDRIGAKTRGWLLLGTFVQAVFTMAAAILLWKGGQSSFSINGPTWTNPEGYAAIAFASASMGLQGIMGKRLDTQFATTSMFVLTTAWCELMADPKLFTRAWVKSRDIKIVSITALFVGGFIGRLVLNLGGATAAFEIATVCRLFIALFWLAVPSKDDADK